ncbi:MAG: WecB/TagA/CpsF family glycosyltransferase [Firmicutes bacterium]|nr:WecB/TagA/CpsF family glycosyltransferase [Bacillota bacterium]
MGDCVEIFGTRVDAVDADKAVARVIGMALADRASYVVTPNVEIVMAARSNERLRRALNGADLAVGDGVGLVWASRVLGRPLPARVSGIDLMTDLLREAPRHGLRVFLLGSTKEIVAAAAERIRSTMNAEVAGFHHGFFSPEEEQKVVDSILRTRPHIIFVGMGSPRQELFMARNVGLIGKGAMIAVGGSFDVLSGAKRRAPSLLRRLGLEWMFRLISEPRRFRRMMALPRFAALVLLTRLKLVKE